MKLLHPLFLVLLSHDRTTIFPPLAVKTLFGDRKSGILLGDFTILTKMRDNRKIGTKLKKTEILQFMRISIIVIIFFTNLG